MSGVFRRKSAPCNACVRHCQWIPVLVFVAGILCCYYAFIIKIGFLLMHNSWSKYIYLLYMHAIGFLFLCCYFQLLYRPAAQPPNNWRITNSEHDRILQASNCQQRQELLAKLAYGLPILNCELNGALRYCSKCRLIKPDRAHHCRSCGFCVLRMDHHCRWVNNCVNFANYKYFVQFLGYSLLMCLYEIVILLQYFDEIWHGQQMDAAWGQFDIIFIFCISPIFLSLFGFHVRLILLNRTTLECFRAPIFRIGGISWNAYNLGFKLNFVQIFGADWKLWFLPVFSSLGDGLKFEVCSKQFAEINDDLNDAITLQNNIVKASRNEDDCIVNIEDTNGIGSEEKLLNSKANMY